MNKKKFKQLLLLLNEDEIPKEKLEQLNTRRLLNFYKVLRDKQLFLNQLCEKTNSYMMTVKQLLDSRENVD